MLWLLIFVLLLLIPILSIVLDSHLGRALAARVERRDIGPTRELLDDRIAFLEGEVDRLAAEVKCLDEEGQLLHQLLETRDPRSTLGPAQEQGERSA